MHRQMLILVLSALHWGGMAPGLVASELALRSSTSIIALNADQQSELAVRLASYFQSCHSYSDVVWGEVLPQEDLRQLWADQERLPHVVLHVTYGADAPSHLREKTFEILFGFSSESGPLPVLARDANQVVTSYIKCPGLEGLLLACHVHGLIPDMQRGPRCREWEDLEAKLSASPADP